MCQRKENEHMKCGAALAVQSCERRHLPFPDMPDLSLRRGGGGVSLPFTSGFSGKLGSFVGSFCAADARAVLPGREGLEFVSGWTRLRSPAAQEGAAPWLGPGSHRWRPVRPSPADHTLRTGSSSDGPTVHLCEAILPVGCWCPVLAGSCVQCEASCAERCSSGRGCLLNVRQWRSVPSREPGPESGRKCPGKPGYGSVCEAHAGLYSWVQACILKITVMHPKC